MIEASHSLTQEQLDQLGFRQLNFDVTDRIDWQDFVAVGETEQQEYQTVSRHEHWSPWGLMSPKGTFTPAGLQHLSLTVPTPAGTFDGNGSTEGLLRVPSRKGIFNDQRRSRALQVWRKVVQQRKQQAAEASDSENTHYDGDSDGGSGSDSSDDDHDGDDQYHHRHNPVMASCIQTFPGTSKTDHLTRPRRPDSFGKIFTEAIRGTTAITLGAASVVLFHEHGGVSPLQLLCRFGGVYSFRSLRKCSSLSRIVYSKCTTRSAPVAGGFWIVMLCHAIS